MWCGVVLSGRADADIRPPHPSTGDRTPGGRGQTNYPSVNDCRLTASSSQSQSQSNEESKKKKPDKVAQGRTREQKGVARRKNKSKIKKKRREVKARRKAHRMVVVFVLHASRPGRSVLPSLLHITATTKKKRGKKKRKRGEKKESRETSPRLSREREGRRR